VNTNRLASELAVSPKTIRRWIQFLDLQVGKNEHGHYIFTTQDLELFTKIKENIKNGKTRAEIKRNIMTNNLEPKPQIDVHHPEEHEDKFKIIFQQLKIQEKRISEKADEVVAYQILVHRKEIEELQTKILLLEEKINHFELEKAVENNKPDTVIQERKKRKGLIRAVLG